MVDMNIYFSVWFYGSIFNILFLVVCYFSGKFPILDKKESSWIFTFILTSWLTLVVFLFIVVMNNSPKDGGE